VLINPKDKEFYNNKKYRVTISTGTYQPKSFEAYAKHEQEAADLVADYIEEEGYKGLYSTYREVLEDHTEEEIENGVSDSQANLLTCGNHGIFVPIISIEKV
jgi:hypothetical protein